MEFERTFVTFYSGHVLFFRNMETFLVNFLKVFSQDHLRKRLLLNHNGNQWYMNTQLSVLYLLYPLRCPTETKPKEMCLVESYTEKKTQHQEQKEKTGDCDTCTMIVAKKQTVYSPASS